MTLHVIFVASRSLAASRGARLFPGRPPSAVAASLLGLGLAVAFAGVAQAAAASGAISSGYEAQTMLANICNFITGAFGQTIAVLGIMTIGLSWMFGRASVGMVAGVVGGIVIMFAAGYLGTMLTSGGTGG